MTNRKNVIADRYEVVSHIGQGGMADVFSCGRYDSESSGCN